MKLFLKALLLTSYVQSTFISAQENQPTPETPHNSETRSLMQPLWASLTRVLPLSLNQSEFSKTENRPKILADLKSMADSSEALAEHSKKFHGPYAYIASSMRKDLADIYRWYEKGSYQESKYLLHQLSENCMSCHVKLKDPGHAPSMQSFFKDVSLADLPPSEKARLQVAMRQFDEALATWEELFNKWPNPSEIFAMDAITEYLKVTIRVKENTKRPLSTLDKLARRSEIPRFMARDISAWRSSIVKNGPELAKKGNEVSRAAKLIKTAQNRMEYPLDRSGLVDFIIASSLLNRAITEQSLKPEIECQALYLIGITETLVGRSAWLSQTDFYMEAAVRVAPQSKFAKLAYEALEHHILMEYSGSGGINIPSDVATNLAELKKLVQR